MIIAVIPARGGSRRIKKKNIKRFAGKPIIGWSIDVALRSGLFDRVIVSTDNSEIAQVALDNGADVPFKRPDYLADNYTGTNAVVKHAIEWFRKEGEIVEIACCIYSTAPFLQELYLAKGLAKLRTTGKSFTFSATNYAFPVRRSFIINQEGEVAPLFPESIDCRSQDLEEVLHDAGQFYWGVAQAFVDERGLFSGASTPVMLPRYLVQDIDTEEDWIHAEAMFKQLVDLGEINIV